MANSERNVNGSTILSLNLKTILFLSFAGGISSGIYYSFIKFSFSNSMLSLLSALLCFILYRCIVKDIYTTAVKIIFVLYLDFVLLPIAWLTTYGSKGPMLYYSIVFIVLSSIIVLNKIGMIVPILTILEVALLWFFEDSYINVINSLSGNYNIIENIQPHYTFACLILLYFLYRNRDNTEKIHDMLHKHSITDVLTNLYNRRYLFDELKIADEEFLLNQTTYILVMIDIDNFKKINDIYGHKIGDEVLHQLGIIINKEIRKHDIGARYGGDEFALVLYETSLDEAKYVINRIITEFIYYAKRYPDIQLGLSVGYSNDNAAKYQSMIEQADSDLYYDKNKKKQL